MAVTAVNAACPCAQVVSLLAVMRDEVCIVGRGICTGRTAAQQFHLGEIVADYTGGHVVGAVTGFEFCTAEEVFHNVRNQTSKIGGFTAEVAVLTSIHRHTIEVAETVSVST